MLLVDGNVPSKQGIPSPELVGTRCVMRLSSPCLTSRRFALAVAVILLFSLTAVAQHSSGGSSGGGSSSASGGGSHSSSSGGSSSASSSGSHSGGSSGSSASSHSSGGSASHSSSARSSSGTASHGSVAHGSSSTPSSSHGAVEPRSNAVHPIHPANSEARAKTDTPQRRGFFSFLRRPIRRPVPTPAPTPGPTKPVADLRRPICFGGACPVCPPGQARAGGKCSGTVFVNNSHNVCPFGQAWNGGACQWQNRYLDDCAGLRFALQQQARRMQAAESEQQSACSTGRSQECSDLTSTAQSEASLYRSLQDRYRMCQQRSPAAYSFGGYGRWNYSSELLFDGLEMDLDYP
jgi:hypothetical protein